MLLPMREKKFPQEELCHSDFFRLGLFSDVIASCSRKTERDAFLVDLRPQLRFLLLPIGCLTAIYASTGHFWRWEKIFGQTPPALKQEDRQ
jgi:hypothetical protein